MVLSTEHLYLWGILLAAIPALFIFGLITYTRQIPKGLRLPPGPPGKPIFGNATDMPTHHEWETFTRWADEYGDLVYINVLGYHIVFANSLEVAHDLLEARSQIYSDRPDFPMLSLMGANWSLSLMHYDHWWRRHRKMFHEGFRRDTVRGYHSIQTQQTRGFLRRLHESPDDFTGHLRHLAGAIIMQIVYGIKLRETGDRYLEIAEEAMAAVAEAGNPASFLVDILPFLKHVPEWFPGAEFQRKARVWRKPVTEMNVVPFMAVKEALSAGTAEPSFIVSLLEKLAHQTDAPEDEEEIIRNVASVAYAAGADTTVAALSTFILAMVLYPHAQRKAQEELDSVIGTDRIPGFEDRENLPYVNALCKEVQRWHPVTPLAAAHRVTQDDVYKNYFIPKGSIVLGNAWAILHDEKLYGPEPEEFRPERFFLPGVKEPSDTGSFGFGRRICPGMHMAESTVFIAVASILKIFDISPAKDGEGNEVPVKGLMTSGAISHPEPFQCTIKLRSASAESLLKEHCNEGD